MSDNVFVNGRAVVHKGSMGKSMAAFPDACLCPPPSPTGPVPTPLPNNALSSDLADGAKTVLVDGNPVGTKKSNLKKSTGNEVARPTGGGVVSHAVQGKACFASFSFDVKAEGQAVVRHLDIMTHNHGSPPNTPPWPFLSSMAVLRPGVCSGEPEDPCKLVAYKDGCPPAADGTKRTPHHVMPAHCFIKEGKRGLNSAKNKFKGKPVTKADIDATCIDGCTEYRAAEAPCVCVTGKDKSDGGLNLLEHGRIHRRIDLSEGKAAHASVLPEPKWTYKECKKASVTSVVATLKTGPSSDARPACSAECISAQLDDYHLRTCNIDGKKQLLRASTRTDDSMREMQRGIRREAKKEINNLG